MGKMCENGNEVKLSQKSRGESSFENIAGPLAAPEEFLSGDKAKQQFSKIKIMYSLSPLFHFSDTTKIYLKILILNQSF
jgi:hypothetical protein